MPQAEKREISLKIGELTERGDFGRGIIRISTKDMKHLGVTEGDVVEIEGKRKTAAVAVRAYPVDVGLDVIRMDGLERRNCGAGIGDVVKIRNAEVKEAKALTLAPARKGLVIHMGNNIIKQNLIMRPFMSGDIIIPNPIVQDRRNQTTLFEQFFGVDFGEMFFTPFGEEKFVVVSTDPKGIVRVTRATDVELLPQATKALEEDKIPEVTYEDLGGLHEEIKKVREMIELPLKHPELFERLGIEPPKGILLHGPPGCLTGEALVAIEDGRLVRIGEIGKNLVPGIYVADLPVYPPAHAKAIHVYDVPETVEIISKSGRRLRMTPNHPLMTDKGWVEAEKLKVGDKVKVFNWIPNPQNYVPTNFILNEKRLVNKIKTPKIWDENIAELVGIFVAEGTIDPRRIKFTIHRDENDLRERIISLAKEIFDADFTERVGITKAVRRIRIANRAVWDFFKILWKKEKSIPQEILLSPNLVAAGFLRGLFEGDGSVVKKNRYFDRAVTLKSKSRQLLEEVQILLLRWSIRSSIYSYRDLYGESHVLKIRGKDNIRKYMDGIGFISKSKTRKLEEQFSTYSRRTPNEDIDFEPIREVRRVNGWERVYDFEVPTTHSFFSNGILSHNTGKTLLAKAVANESGAKFLVLNGPECMCIDGDTEVKTTDGVKTARVLYEEIKNDGKITERKQNLEVIVPNKDFFVYVLDNENKIVKDRIHHAFRLDADIYKIKMSNGSEVRGSHNQPLLVKKERCNEWVALKDLDVNKEAAVIDDNGNMSFAKINSIEHLGEGEVFDFAINPYSNFIGGNPANVVLHNSKFYGESEENLRKIFDQAEKSAPSIVFIDEIDAIAPKREEVKGEVEKRVVSQLLTLLDGLKSRGKVIVIGATNLPNSLDPALRRPGRFDREIELGVPNKDGRKEILQIHTRGMPLLNDVNIDKISEITYGYVGADLLALCKEAAMHALRRVLPDLGEIKEDKPIDENVLKRLVVSKEDFDHALKIVEPSAMREVLIEIPKVTWDEIGGLEEVKGMMKEVVEWPLKHPDAFKRMGIKPPTGILLYGPPGCGKTLMAKAVANESGANFISVKGPELLSMYVGESERHIRDVFRRAKQVAPSIIFFDEIDALVPRRSYSNDSHVSERVVSQLLAEISGLEELHDVVVIAATNRPDIVDPALLRPGRFDRQILVPTPDEKTRLEILKVHTDGMPIADDVSIEKLSKETTSFSGADLEALAREAAMSAMRKDINADEVTAKDFAAAMKEIKPSVSDDMNKFYESIMKRRKSRALEEEVTYTG